MRRELHIGVIFAAAILAGTILAGTSLVSAQVEPTLDEPVDEALDEPVDEPVDEPAVEPDEPPPDEPALDEPTLELDDPTLAERELDEPSPAVEDLGEDDFDDAADALAPGDPVTDGASAEPAPATRVAEAAAFGGAASFLAGEEALWVLDDGVGIDELPWDGYDREIGYVPRGAVHAGVQLRVAAVLGGGINVPDGPLFELAGFVDIRYRPTGPWRIRLAIAASVQAWNEQYLGAGTIVSSSPFSLRTRALFLNVDLGRWVNVRAGGDVGIQWTPSGGDGRVDIAGGPTGEITLLLLEGALELGVAGGMQLTAHNRTDRSYTTNGFSALAVIGGTVAYVIP